MYADAQDILLTHLYDYNITIYEYLL